SGQEALELLRERRFDCMVLDLGLPDMNGFEFISRLKSDLDINDVPIVVYTGRDLTRKEETELKRMAEAIIIKDVRSPERLLDETALFLHRVEANLPAHKRQLLEQLHESDPVLAGKTALIVDDDMRNIYALTSLLERHKMKVLFAESGAEGISQIQQHAGELDVVLMDVMMPEMDGYEAMRRIRSMEEFKNLPMIALTAKAMKGDREKCMEAGASDYITKPIDAQQLVSLLRVWLYR
ncbi:MAG: sensor hybrid histidine kinase, partial [Acidobacteria bacterium]|nr:sensor hybrid histidine kinase [Acidobacteriota bacterium]